MPLVLHISSLCHVVKALSWHCVQAQTGTADLWIKQLEFFACMES